MSNQFLKCASSIIKYLSMITVYACNWKVVNEFLMKCEKHKSLFISNYDFILMTNTKLPERSLTDFLWRLAATSIMPPPFNFTYTSLIFGIHSNALDTNIQKIIHSYFYTYFKYLWLLAGKDIAEKFTGLCVIINVYCCECKEDDY